MTELIIPDMPKGGIITPQYAPEITQTDTPEKEESVEVKTTRAASQLPDPTGYRILVALPEVSEKTEGGIYKAQEAIKIEEVATVTGYVIKVGPDAYNDPRKFPGEPYCKEGDWVIFRAFSGTRIKVHGQEFRLINDDSVEAVVEDPQGITRA